MKKKYVVSPKDKKDWAVYTKQMGKIGPKAADIIEQNTKKNKIKKLDLHGHSLNKANEVVGKFVTECFNNGYKKLLIITGKGSRLRNRANPYISEKMSILRYSIPDYIKNNENLGNKINRISVADIKHGGEGAIYIYLKV